MPLFIWLDTLVSNISFTFMHVFFTARKRSLRRLCFYRCVSVHRGGGIPACLAGHMTRQQYISRCTVDVSQLVWRQHTGNIKCMMGYVTWYTPQDGEAPGMENPPGWRTPPQDGEPPQMETPRMENPPGMEKPPRWRTSPDWEPLPPDGEPPLDPENVHFNCNNTFLTCFYKIFT